jgi:signal recognition particle protein
VEASSDLDLQDKEGYTPLHMAAGYMHTGSMTVLLEAGADPTLRDNKGKVRERERERERERDDAEGSS